MVERETIMKYKMQGVATRTSLAYWLLSMLYILFSEEILLSFTHDPNLLSTISLYKGWGFVTVTAILLYFTLRGQLSRWDREAAAREKAEKELKASEERFSKSFHSSPAAMLITDRVTGKIVDLNQAWLRLTGFHRKDIIGRTLLETGLVRESVHELLQPMKKGSVPRAEPLESVIFTSSGRALTVLISREELETNGVQYILAALEDITARKQAEAELKHTVSQLNATLESTADGILVVDRSGRISGYNHRFIDLWAVPDETIATREEANVFAHMRSLLAAPEDFRSRMESLRIRPEEESDDVVALRDERIFECSSRPQKLEGGPAGRVWSFRDISAREQAQHELRTLYRAIEQSDDIIFMTDPDGMITYINPAFERIYGYAKSEAIGKSPRILKSGTIRQSQYEAFWQAIRSGKSLKTEYLNKRKDGSFIPVESSVSPIFGAENRLVGFMALQKDVSERKRSEEQLLIRDYAIQSSISAIALAGMNEKIIFANDTCVRLWGYRDSSEMLGKELSSFVSSGERAVKLLEAVREGRSYVGEEVARRVDGTLFDVEVFANVVMSRDGYPLCIMVSFVDITEKKVAERKLRESEEQFRLISENVADLIALLDVTGRRIYNSPSYKSILGDPAQLKGTDSFQEVHPADRERLWKVFQDTVSSGHGQRAEYRLMTRDGKLRYIESQGSVIRDDQGNVRRVLVVSRDITEKKQLEEQLLRAQRMESIGTLAGGVAHDLNNVLSPIMLAVDILGRKLTSPTDKRLLESLERSARRGRDIVKQVLTFARGIEGEHVLVQPKHVIREIESIIHETFPKSIDLAMDISPDLKPLHGNATQVHQVLLNLVVNARDAMPTGGKMGIVADNVTIDEQYARMRVDARPGDYVRIAVKDSGHGIPRDIIDKIFDPFFTTKDVGKGTGLGLSTVMGIVKAHNGFVDVVSEHGQGATFIVHFPAAKIGAGEGVEAAMTSLPQGRGEMILVVDDESSICEITKATLEANGYAVLIANEGTEAVSRFVEHKDQVNLVLIDMMMPYMDGPSTIRALKTLNPWVRVVAMSGLSENEELLRNSSLGVKGFLPKPYTAQKLLKIIADALSNV